MNAFFSRGVTAIRDWCHRNFQSAELNAVTGQAASGEGNWSFFSSAARFLTAPAPMIPRLTIPSSTNTVTGAGMAATKAKPSIVRIIRVRRRRPAGESRFLGEFGGRKTANG